MLQWARQHCFVRLSFLAHTHSETWPTYVHTQHRDKWEYQLASQLWILFASSQGYSHTSNYIGQWRQDVTHVLTLMETCKRGLTYVHTTHIMQRVQLQMLILPFNYNTSVLKLWETALSMRSNQSSEHRLCTEYHLMYQQMCPVTLKAGTAPIGP